MSIVRPALAGEIKLLAAIGLASWEKAVSGLVDPAGMRVSAYNSFMNFLEDNWLIVDVAENDGRAAGWVARENRDNQITDLWIEPALQRRGLGSLLLLATEGRIISAGHETASLETHARNAQAIAFFESRGYAISWLSVTYSGKLDRNVETVGLRKHFEQLRPDRHGFDF